MRIYLPLIRRLRRHLPPKGEGIIMGGTGSHSLGPRDYRKTGLSAGQPG